MMIPLEALYVHNVSAGIEDFLRDEGFHVITEMVSQIKEAKVPCDVAIGAKRQSDILIFGLQFKRPYRSRGSSTVGWRLTQPQLSNLQKEWVGKWIWYALPWDINIARGRRWLWMCHFVSPLHIPRDSKALTWDLYRLYSQNKWFPSKHICETIIIVKHMIEPLECYHLPSSSCSSLQSLKKSITRNLCPCVTIPDYDSWGTLYQKLLNRTVGIFVPREEDAEDAIKRALGSAIELEAITEGIIMVIDMVKRIVGIARVAASELEGGEEYMPPDLFPGE
jgi:hypothetical protein